MILFPPPITLSFLQLLTLSEQTIKRLTHHFSSPSPPILFYKRKGDMDGWDRSLRDHQHPYRRHIENPSFSSTLLDAIYRSIDDAAEGEELVLCRDTMRKKQSNSPAVKGCGVGGFEDDDEDMANLRRACLIEKWMEKKVTEKVVVVRRMSVADFERKPQSVFLKSSSSSSDSSSGGGFSSSSETESINGLSSSRSSSTLAAAAHRPKPIRTSVSAAQPAEKFSKKGISEFKLFDKCHHHQNKPNKHENGFMKTKSKAMKLYGDLKKAKEPISPGGKLASFLNSLFTSGTSKKTAKISSETKSKSSSTSTCSSASSFSRSCLSKTPSSRGKSSNNGTKRSVRFVDEDIKQGESTLRNSINEELKLLIMEKNQRVEEAARDLLKSYQKKVEYEFENYGDREEEEEDDDDAASYESSDLFELDNLSAIGIDERYREELPVYETTHLDTNRAIANGLIS